MDDSEALKAFDFLLQNSLAEEVNFRKSQTQDDSIEVSEEDVREDDENRFASDDCLNYDSDNIELYENEEDGDEMDIEEDNEKDEFHAGQRVL